MLAFFLTQAAQQFEPFPPTPFDRVIPIVIDEKDAVLAGHGRAERVAYKTEFSGTLHLWTKSARELDLFLRVETPSGELVQEDDNSGGGTTPYLKLEVESGREFVIVVAVTQSEAVGAFEMRAIASCETAETLAAFKHAKLESAEVKRLREAGDLDAARTRARAVIENLSSLPDGSSSELVGWRMWEFGAQCYGLSSTIQSAAAAWSHALRHRLRTLPEQHPDLLRARQNLAVAIRELGDLAGARELEERVLEVRSRTLPEDHPQLQAARQNLAATLEALGDPRSARPLLERVLEVYTRTLPEEHIDLLTAQQNLASTIKQLGDLVGARALEEHVLSVRSRALPDEDPNLWTARENLAVTLRKLGDLSGARALEEKVLDVASRTLPEDHRGLQSARSHLAATLKALGEFQNALSLERRVVDVFTRTLPEDHRDLQAARGNLASTLQALGDLRGARSLLEQVLESFSRTLPEEHQDLQRARQGLALTIQALGDLQGARTLQERVLEVYSRTLPEEHPELQQARLNLAGMMNVLGDLQGARALEERVLEVYSRTLSEEHPELQQARLNLAGTMYVLGDLQGARALNERVLEVFSRTLSEEHPDLQAARGNLAATIEALGDLQGARALEERVLEVYSRTLPEEHPDLQLARQNLAATLMRVGDFAGAQASLERVLEVLARTLPEQHPDLQRARQNLATTRRQLGDFESARALLERVLGAYSCTLPESHPYVQGARWNLAAACFDQAASTSRRAGIESETRGEIEGWLDRGVSLLRDRCNAQSCTAREVRLNAPGREAESRCAGLTAGLGFTLSAALGYGGLEPRVTLQPSAFLYSESTRNAGVSSSALGRRASRFEGHVEARAQLRSATDELARLVQAGTNREGYRMALAAREAAEKVLLELGCKASGGQATSLELDLDTLTAALKPGDVAVAYRSYTRLDLEWPAASNADGVTVPEETSAESLCAFIVRPRDPADTADTAGSLTLIDLGPIEPIKAAIVNWRGALGASEGRGVRVNVRDADPALEARGAEVRRLVFDPLRKSLGDAHHVVTVLDGPLQLVPFDALPAGDDDAQRLGDILRIETRATLGELLDAPLPLEGERVLVGLGGAEFDGESADAKQGSDTQSASTAGIAASVPTKNSALPAMLRGGAFGAGFTSLPGTLGELEGLEREFAKSVGAGATLSLLRGKDATKQALLAAAPRARWLHIATHGWFAPESIRSWEDRDPIDAKSGLAFRQSGEETVKGMSPMLLCGLALAGANLPEDAVGRAPGLLTADELSTLDLSNCELAVLSACDTARGEMRRAGQGVASLQKALQIAGARSVITSLWKVPDEATKELMLDFYRRIWVDKKPKWQALWEAKLKLRNAKDERGAPKYTTRDWAAWVLTGEPE